ncbi:hypothetical protein [Streptomyces spiralis]
MPLEVRLQVDLPSRESLYDKIDCRGPGLDVDELRIKLDLMRLTDVFGFDISVNPGVGELEADLLVVRRREGRVEIESPGGASVASRSACQKGHSFTSSSQVV